MEPMVPMQEAYSSQSTNLTLTRSHVFSGTSMKAEAVLAEPTASQEKVELEVMVETGTDGDRDNTVLRHTLMAKPYPNK